MRIVLLALILGNLSQLLFAEVCEEHFVLKEESLPLSYVQSSYVKSYPLLNSSMSCQGSIIKAYNSCFLMTNIHCLKDESVKLKLGHGEKKISIFDFDLISDYDLAYYRFEGSDTSLCRELDSLEAHNTPYSKKLISTQLRNPSSRIKEGRKLKDVKNLREIPYYQDESSLDHLGNDAVIIQGLSSEGGDSGSVFIDEHGFPRYFIKARMKDSKSPIVFRFSSILSELQMKGKSSHTGQLTTSGYRENELSLYRGEAGWKNKFPIDSSKEKDSGGGSGPRDSGGGSGPRDSGGGSGPGDSDGGTGAGDSDGGTGAGDSDGGTGAGDSGDFSLKLKSDLFSYGRDVGLCIKDGIELIGFFDPETKLAIEVNHPKSLASSRNEKIGLYRKNPNCKNSNYDYGSQFSVLQDIDKSPGIVEQLTNSLYQDLSSYLTAPMPVYKNIYDIETGEIIQSGPKKTSLENEVKFSKKEGEVRVQVGKKLFGCELGGVSKFICYSSDKKERLVFDLTGKEGVRGKGETKLNYRRLSWDGTKNPTLEFATSGILKRDKEFDKKDYRPRFDQKFRLSSTTPMIEKNFLECLDSEDLYLIRVNLYGVSSVPITSSSNLPYSSIHKVFLDSKNEKCIPLISDYSKFFEISHEDDQINSKINSKSFYESFKGRLSLTSKLYEFDFKQPYLLARKEKKEAGVFKMTLNSNSQLEISYKGRNVICRSFGKDRMECKGSDSGLRIIINVLDDIDKKGNISQKLFLRILDVKERKLGFWVF